MEKIEAILREDRLPVVLAALGELGYGGITITLGARPRAAARRDAAVARQRVPVDFLPKVKIELIVADKDVRQDHRRRSARTPAPAPSATARSG